MAIFWPSCVGINIFFSSDPLLAPHLTPFACLWCSHSHYLVSTCVWYLQYLALALCHHVHTIGRSGYDEVQAQDIGEISICPYLALALCTIGYLALASAYDIMSNISRSCAGSQRCGDMISAGSQSLALALEDVSQRWLLGRVHRQEFFIPHTLPLFCTKLGTVDVLLRYFYSRKDL